MPSFMKEIELPGWRPTQIAKTLCSSQHLLVNSGARNCRGETALMWTSWAIGVFLGERRRRDQDTREYTGVHVETQRGAKREVYKSKRCLSVSFKLAWPMSHKTLVDIVSLVVA